MTQSKPIAHISLVSDQPLPNILPTLVEEIRPELSVLLVSAKMAKKAEFLSDGLKLLGIKTELVELPDDILGDVNALNELMKITLERLNESFHLVINATGGTKILSIASFLSGLNLNLDVIYYDNNHVIWLNSSVQRTSLVLTSSLPLDIFLKVHGIKIEEKQTSKVPQKLTELMQKWVAREKGGDTIGRLNYLAAKAENRSPFIAKLNKEEKNDGRLNQYLQDLSEIGLINITKGADAVEFKSQDNRYFINGGWLEEFIYDRLEALRKEYPSQITYVARNVTVKYEYDVKELALEESKTKNELDVMAIVNNQLWVFEVKTKDMKQSNADSGENPTQGMMYKLAGIIHRLGGSYARGVVVSFRKIGPYDKDRATIMKLSMIEGNEISGVKKRLKSILNLQR